MVTDYVVEDVLGHILAALMPANARVCRVCLATGLRVGDALQLRTAQIQKQRFTIREEKTGKPRRIYLPAALWAELRANSGDIWVFPGRDPTKHRTRQAVWADIKRAQKMFRVQANIGTHSMRKVAAVELFKRTGDLMAVQEFLQHDRSSTTMIYAMADALTAAKKKPGTKRRKKKKRPP